MTEEETSSPGYWEAVSRDLRRNRLAMAGLLFILLVALVAVFCPLIANQRPLYIRALMQGDFDNALQIGIEQLGRLEKGGDLTPGALQEARRLLLANMKAMREHLPPAERGKLELLLDRYHSAKGNASVLTEIAAGLDPYFDAALVPVTRFPALRGLTTGEVFALLAFITTIPISLLRRRLRSRVLLLALLMGLPTVGTVLWKSIYPTVQDSRPYRRMIESADFASSGGRAVRTLIPYGENENILTDARRPPSFLIAKDKRAPVANWHWLGTDTNGRDVLTRMIYGSRVSMLIGILAVSVYTVIGIILGAAAGYFRGWTDIGLSRLIEIVICFPPLMLILSVQAFLKPSIANIILTLAALWWTGVARLQRAEFLRIVNMDFVQSVRALGGSDIRIMALHILPNGLGSILVMVSFGIAGSILIESGLSFLGFGVPQPMASWGDLLNNGRNDIKGLWWLTIFPGLAIFLTVTCFNLIGEGVRDALDPRRER